MSGAALARPVPLTPFEERFGHPRGLAVLFFTEMWERFCFYGMRGLLRAYMVYSLFSLAARGTYPGDDAPDLPGPPLNPSHVWGYEAIRWFYASDASVGDFASHLYGLYTALVYLTPFVGGLLADRWFGQRKTVVVGGLIMALGEFAMGSRQFFFLALGLLIIGNGLFKPNVSTQVGDLYAPGDPRRDGAFTIFYMGINLGAFICNFVCATLAQEYGWKYGFWAAGVGMLLGLVQYLLGAKHLAPEAPRTKEHRAKAQAEKQPFTKSEWKVIGALIFLCLLNVPFWAVYEQQGNTMQAWADLQTHWPRFGSFQVPAAWFQSFNPLMIIALSPMIELLWRDQRKKNQEPSTVAKMAWGSLILGGSFFVMVAGAWVVGDGKGSLFWPFFCTLLLTVGEVYLSPTGLSLVTKASPPRIVSMMMGLWLGSSFFGNYLCGWLGTFYDDMPRTAFFSLLAAIGIATGLATWAAKGPLKAALGET